MKSTRLLTIPVVTGMVVLSSWAAEAQETGRTPASVGRQSWSYAVLGVGPSVCDSSITLHAALGREWLIGDRLGLGGEAGAIANNDDLSSCAAGVLSANVLYHFSHRSGRRWSPFVTGGLSALVAEGGGAGVDFGAGVARFTSQRLGFRLEARVHLWPNENRLSEVRLGVSF